MATKKKTTKSIKKDTRTLTNGALSLVILFSILIGLLLGYLIAYLTF